MKRLVIVVALAGTVALSAATSHARRVEPITVAALTRPPADTVTIRVRNFWATWCKPCIEEMPVFRSLARRNPSIRIELISLDSPKDSARVRAFWQRRGFGGVQVYHLRQTLRTADIDAIASEWSGAIPMTIVERGNRRIVHEGQLDEPTLEALIGSVRD